MIQNYFKYLVISVLLVSNFAFAETAADSAEAEPPSSGRLASVSSGGLEPLQADGAWAGDTKDGGSGAPLGASVRRDGSNWFVSVTNKSEDHYSGSIKVSQSDEKGKNIRSDYFSVSLKAGQQTERKLRAHNKATAAAVDLTSWSAKKKEPDLEVLEEEIAEKQALLEELKASDK